MSNEANYLSQNNQNEQEKQPLQDLDLSHLILIKNPNNEVAIGYCPESKFREDPLNTTGNEKQIIHQHYGTIHYPIDNNNGQGIYAISPAQFIEWKIHSILIKYVVLLLSLILVTLDVKIIRNRISTQEDIISEVKY